MTALCLETANKLLTIETECHTNNETNNKGKSKKKTGSLLIKKPTRMVQYLAHNWNHILPGVQKYIREKHSDAYLHIKREIDFCQQCVLTILENSSVLQEKENVYRMIIEFLCYANI